MNIEQLEYIVEIAKSGSFSAAAHQLHITQSALSQSVSKLEEELGLTLFKRSYAGAEITEEGRRILNKAMEAIQTIDEIKELSRFESNRIRGELNVAAFPGVMPVLVRCLASIKQDYPLVQINIEENTSNLIMDDIKLNRIGLGLIAMYKKDIEQLAGLVFEPIVQGKFVICANKNSEIAKHKSIHPKDLVKYPFALFNDVFVDDFLADHQANYGELPILFQTNNGEAIRTALEENMAVTIGHDFSFFGQRKWLSDQYVLIEIKPIDTPAMQVGWIRSEKNHMTLLHQLCRMKFDQEFNRAKL